MSNQSCKFEIAGREGEMTFTEIGERLGISAVRARELYLKGMNKLRRTARLFELLPSHVQGSIVSDLEKRQ